MSILVSHYIKWIWPAALIGMQVTLFYVDGFPINASVIALALLFVLCLPVVRVRPVILFSVVVTLLYVLMFVFFATDIVEFIKSYFLFASLLAVVGVSGGLAKCFPESGDISLKVMIGLGLIVACLIILQAIAWNYGKIDWLIAPLGLLSPRGPGGEVYVPLEYMTLKRPNGIYSEPSIAGWMMAYLAALVGIAKYSMRGETFLGSKKVFLLFSIAALLTGTISGLVSIVTVWVATGFVWLKQGKKSIQNISVVSGILVAAVLLLAYMPIFATQHLEQRLENFDKPGTSTYYRLIAPFLLVKDSVKEYPLGHPLGQVDYIETKDFMINWEGGSQTNIDNSAFLVAYYFGLPGIVVIIMGLPLLVSAVFKGNAISPLIMAQCTALLSTGGLWSPSMSLMIGFTLVVSYRIVYEINSSKMRHAVLSGEVSSVGKRSE